MCVFKYHAFIFYIRPPRWRCKTIHMQEKAQIVFPASRGGRALQHVGGLVWRLLSWGLDSHPSLLPSSHRLPLAGGEVTCVLYIGQLIAAHAAKEYWQIKERQNVVFIECNPKLQGLTSSFLVIGQILPRNQFFWEQFNEDDFLPCYL